MTNDERCKQYRSIANRYKHKYLKLKMSLPKIFKEIAEKSFDITHIDDKLNYSTGTVVDLNDVLQIIDKYTKEV